MLDQHSVTWRLAGDARLLPFLGTAFLLQAAHPTIAAGVADHSNFKVDPFGRFQQSWGRVLEVVYAADGDRVGAEVRGYHKQIKGTKPDGTSYHAYEPEAYFWVLASGYEALVVAAQRFMRPLAPGERRRFYDEMREVGRRFGLRDRDMPTTLAEFDDWYGWVLAERIEDSDTVRDVLATIRRPNPPGGVPELAWRLPRPIVSRFGWLTTIGALPAPVRGRLGIPWGRADEAQLAVIARAFKALNRAPASWFYLPPAREAFARTNGPLVPDAVPEDLVAA